MLERAPRHPAGHYYRGVALVGLGRAEEAIPVFERARDLDPAGSRAAFVLGRLLIEAGREGEALSALESAAGNDHFPGARGQRIQAHVTLARLLLLRAVGGEDWVSQQFPALPALYCCLGVCAVGRGARAGCGAVSLGLGLLDGDIRIDSFCASGPHRSHGPHFDSS